MVRQEVVSVDRVQEEPQKLLPREPRVLQLALAFYKEVAHQPPQVEKEWEAGCEPTA